MLLIYPRVALSRGFMMHGLPKTTEWEGTSTFTKLQGAMSTSSPMVMFPTIAALIPIHTWLPITGVPFRAPRFA